MAVISDVKRGCRIHEKSKWQNEMELWGSNLTQNVNHWKKTGEDFYEILWHHEAILREKPFHSNPDPIKEEEEKN